MILLNKHIKKASRPHRNKNICNICHFTEAKINKLMCLMAMLKLKRCIIIRTCCVLSTITTVQNIPFQRSFWWVQYHEKSKKTILNNIRIMLSQNKFRSKSIIIRLIKCDVYDSCNRYYVRNDHNKINYKILSREQKTNVSCNNIFLIPLRDGTVNGLPLQTWKVEKQNRKGSLNKR